MQTQPILNTCFILQFALSISTCAYVLLVGSDTETGVKMWVNTIAYFNYVVMYIDRRWCLHQELTMTLKERSFTVEFSTK